MPEYTGKHRPKPYMAFLVAAVGSERDRMAKRDGYHYVPRHSSGHCGCSR